MYSLCVFTVLFNSILCQETWFSYDIHDLQSESVQNLIRNSTESLRNNNIFSVGNFLSENTLHMLQNEILSLYDKVAWSTHYKTVYQDKGDDTFVMANNTQIHPRNHKRLTRKGYLGRSDLTKMFIDIYNHKPLLLFLKQIVTIAKNYSDLHLSNDKEGSVYGQMYRNGSVNGYHFDQHSFSCVWLLQKPLNQTGGFRYIKMKDDNTRNWNALNDILNVDKDDDILAFYANEGDITCFIGNTTLHGVDEIEGNRMRLAFVTTYSEYANFKHSHDVNEFNTWGEHKTEL
eukprot:512548_1